MEDGTRSLCCDKICGGKCGAPLGCSSRPGGATGCCGSQIHRACSASIGAPCRLAPDPPPVGHDASANKTWLLFQEDVIVAVGDALQPTKGGLVTSVEQAKLHGQVFIGGAGGLEKGQLLQPGSYRQLDLGNSSWWVSHNGVGYLLPRTAGAVAHVGAVNKTGSWSLLGVGSDTAVTMEVFDLFIEHRSRYLYLTLPTGGTPADMPEALASNAGGHALGLGIGYHAATDPSGTVLLAAVWGGGETTLTLGNWSVRTSRACALALRRWPYASVTASASVPGSSGGALALTMGGRTKTFALPAGDFAGSSVSAVMCQDC